MVSSHRVTEALPMESTIMRRVLDLEFSPPGDIAVQ
jgi:hypothetical protein